MFEPKEKIIDIMGVRVPIDPDFRIMCRFGSAMQRDDKAEMTMAAKDFYFADLPDGISAKEAVNAMADFYCKGFGAVKQKKSTTQKSEPPSFDFEEDEAYFYAAFLEHYRIDLTTAKLHWLDFGRLFMGLPEECRLRQMIGIRAVKLSEIKAKSEKERIAKLKRVYALSSVCTGKHKPKNLEERNRAMRENLLKMHEEVRKNG